MAVSGAAATFNPLVMARTAACCRASRFSGLAVA